MSMNVITGLPRSGSTLLCNVLNQNPKFYASSTSILPQLCSTLIRAWSSSPDFRGHLQNEEMEVRLRASMQAFCGAWHGAGDKTVFDKSRGWTYNLLALWSIFPDAKVIITVRDLRNVYASVEKQHRKNGLLDEAANPVGKTLFSRADMMFGPNNLIGGPLGGIQDVLQRGFTSQHADPRVLIVRYEDLTASPKNELSKIYQYLDESEFQHDFKDVKNTATDPDHLYLFKYPHKGEGKISKGDPNEWQKFMSPDLGMMIWNRFPWFYHTFYPEMVEEIQKQQAQMRMRQQPQMAQQQMMQQGGMQQPGIQGQGGLLPQGQLQLPPGVSPLQAARAEAQQRGLPH